MVLDDLGCQKVQMLGRGGAAGSRALHHLCREAGVAWPYWELEGTSRGRRCVG